MLVVVGLVAVEVWGGAVTAGDGETQSIDRMTVASNSHHHHHHLFIIFFQLRLVPRAT